MDWFNYVSLLQWKVSDHEVSLLSITSLGFCCVYRNWSHQTSVWSCRTPTKQIHFRFSCMHWRVLFRKAWLRDWFSTFLNLVWHHCGAAAVYSFWSISSLAFTNDFECMKTVNIWCDKFKPFSSGGLSLPATHLTSIYHMTALRMLHFIPRAKHFS